MLDLTNGDKVAIPEGATFKFAKGSKFVAVKLNKANAAAKHNGTDLVLRELSTGLTQNIGNVNLYDFVNALTASAKSGSPSRRLEIEPLAGDVLARHVGSA